MVVLELHKPLVIDVASETCLTRLVDAEVVGLEVDGTNGFHLYGKYRDLIPPKTGSDCDCCKDELVEQLEAEINTLKRMVAEERKRAEAFRTILTDRIAQNDRLIADNEGLRRMIDGLAARVADQSELLSRLAEKAK